MEDTCALNVFLCWTGGSCNDRDVFLGSEAGKYQLRSNF